jgi:hypothetical protein
MLLSVLRRYMDDLSMAPKLRVHKSQEPHSLIEGQSTVLSYSDSRKPPPFERNTRDAYVTEGRHCTNRLSSDAHMWCERHIGQTEASEKQWERADEDAEPVEVLNLEGEIRSLGDSILSTFWASSSCGIR